MKLNTKLLILLASLHAFDVIATWYGVTSNLTCEGNPIAQWFITNCGWVGLFSIKVGGTALFYTLTFWKAIDKLLTSPLILANILMGFLSLHHVVLLGILMR